MADCSGGFTSSNEDAGVFNLRFLHGAMLISVRMFGVLVVAVVALEVVFWSSGAEESALVSPALQLTNGRDVTMSLTSLHS